MDKNKLFHKIAHEILATSLKSSIPRPSHSTSAKLKLGDKLFEGFVRELLIEYKGLKAVDGKCVTFFNRGNRNILSIEKQSAAIKITINAKKDTLKDSKELLRDVSKVGHWGNGDYQIKLEDRIYFDDVLGFIRQIY